MQWHAGVARIWSAPLRVRGVVREAGRFRGAMFHTFLGWAMARRARAELEAPVAKAGCWVQCRRAAGEAR
jgi:hypothetical protein